MTNAIDAFRQQRAAAEEVYAVLKNIANLLGSLKQQTDTLMRIDELRELLEQERAWLHETQRTLTQIRELRAGDLRRLRTSRAAQWTAAIAFALAAAVAAGAGYALVTQPYAAELSELRSRQEFAELIERRFVTMTPVERRQFDALMKWSAPIKR